MDLPDIKHVIWDWNGTLLDDAWLCVELINGILARRNLPTLSMEHYRDTFDFPVINYYERLGLHSKEEPFEEVSKEFISGYVSRWKDCKLQPDARENLETISNLGISQSVLSASHQDALDEAITHFRLNGFFLGLIGQDDNYAHGKLERGQEWVSHLDWAPEEILLIGDTVHDFEVAGNIGMHCVLLSHGHHAEKKLHQCDIPVFSHFEQIHNILSPT